MSHPQAAHQQRLIFTRARRWRFLRWVLGKLADGYFTRRLALFFSEVIRGKKIEW